MLTSVVAFSFNSLSSNADLCETIVSWKLKHCPTMWQFQATTALRDISSTGTLFPKLTIEWNNLKITNLLTQQTIPLPNLVRVSSLRARRIRQMLNGAFYVKLVFYHDNHATYIPDYDKQRVLMMPKVDFIRCYHTNLTNLDKGLSIANQLPY